MSKQKSRPTPVAYPGLANLFDAHTHLFSHPDADADLVLRAQEAGVDRLVTVGNDLAESGEALRAAQELDVVWAACAIHPTKAHELDDAARAALTQMAQDPCCVAVGETGLDNYWIQQDPENTATLDEQVESLLWHAELAAQVNKTLMIHNREADADLLRVLGQAPAQKQVMLHCFSSPLEVAKEALDRGYVLSFAGNVTFKRNAELREAARLAPAGQLLVETDAPYMTPEPFRGQRNESALIGHTWACIAEVRGVSVAQLAEELNPTFDKVFAVED